MEKQTNMKPTLKKNNRWKKKIKTDGWMDQDRHMDSQTEKQTKQKIKTLSEGK